MTLSRRELLSRTAALAVTAYLPATRGWAVEPDRPPGSVPLPDFDGELFLDGELVDEAASDFGHLVSRRPRAVLRPGSVGDVQKLVRFARRHGIRVSGMGIVGESHSTFGQAQARAGVVIDAATLSAIHEVNAGDAVVDAGVRWLDLLEVTAPLGKSPPTLTDFLELTVGGTLSVGGIGGQAFRSGFQVDNVLELEVVTGRGELVTCSPTERRGLFSAVRAGLGQFAVIVRVRVRLVDVPPQTRTYTALYADLTTFTADQELLIRDGRFDYLEGQALPGDGGGWVFLLEAVKYFAPDAPPDDAAQLAGLSYLPGTAATEDRTYFDFANRLAPIVELLRQIGVWDLPHPWLNLFVPGSLAPAFIQGTLDGETVASTGQGPILIYPCFRAAVRAPFVALPDSEVFFLFAILRNTLPGTDPHGQLARNRAIVEALRDVGGKRYPVGSVPSRPGDWRRHFGRLWPRFVLAKRAFDPRRILTPGQGIFRPPDAGRPSDSP